MPSRPAAPARPAEPEAPTKVVTVTLRLERRCRVGYIDFEGRADGEAMQKLLAKVAPRKLILVRGSDAAKTRLREYCEKTRCAERVFAPANNQQVDVSSEINMYRISLQGALVSGSRFAELDSGFEVAYVDGLVRIDYSQSNLPMLDAAPRGRVHGHPAVFLGEVPLSDIADVLIRNGISAVFVGGILVCAGGVVNIRKVSATRISLQGALCEEYLRIRKLLYGQYQIV